MRDFFINALDKLITVVVILMILGVLIAAVMVSMDSNNGGILMGLAVLVGGALYVILLGGFMYLGLGIYHNTRRTAAATEAMANR